MRKTGNLVFLVAAFLTLLTGAIASQAQTPSPAAKEILRPPAGSKIALVVFEDMQCPDCARAQVVLEEAKKNYKMPVVIYDFPLLGHPWAHEAAVWAHYFRSKSTKTNNLEDAYRQYIYRNQPAITPENLRTYVSKFAMSKGVDMPFVLDSQGKFAAEVEQDKAKGTQVKIEHTPTIYIVNNKPSGKTSVEVLDRRQLFAMIDDMQAE